MARRGNQLHRLTHFDIARRFDTPAKRAVARITLGVACGLLMIGLRMLVGIWAPGTGLFSLIYPAVLLATLYGRWEAGLVAFAVAFGWACYQTFAMGIGVRMETQAASIAGLNALSILVVLIFAETFRYAVEHERLQREAEIERRAVLLAELEHRTKNNFALVASLLELQKRREGSKQIVRAFDDAIGRVRTFAEAYTHLAGEQGEGVVVEMRPYLHRMVERVSGAMLPPEVKVEARCADVSLPRESAVAIGLFANEALTNCAKYAFPQSRPGKVVVHFEAQGEKWRLVIRDNGVGNAAPPPTTTGGIGSKLLEAFARQARARHATRFGPEGCEVSLSCDGGDARAA
ncbi:sensor histidine kinase [uncultured Novosphingobium sp.]|uniref:sensor histidine kinase n=1 Tax=uncultured Novosphingobium sp. TaxID=292277 RepID=UPI0037487DBC